MGFIITAIQFLGSVFMIGIAAFAAVYAYRMISEDDNVLAGAWSFVSAALISLVFFRAIPDFFVAVVLLSVAVYALVYALNRVLAKRVYRRRRKTYLDGKEI